MTDTAKELLALRDWMREPDHAAEFRLPGLIEWINRRPIPLVERLSARQQASVEEIDQLLMGTCSVNMTYGSCQRQAERSRVALLAKYDIFEKVEG